MGAQLPAAFRVVGEKENRGGLSLAEPLQACGGGFVAFIPIAQPHNMQGGAGGRIPGKFLISEQGDASGGVDAFYLLLLFVVMVAQNGVDRGYGAEFPEALNSPAGAHESLMGRDEVAAEDDEVRLGGFDVFHRLFEEFRVVVNIGEEGDFQRTSTRKCASWQLHMIALQLPGAVLAEILAPYAADECKQEEQEEIMADFFLAKHGGND